MLLYHGDLNNTPMIEQTNLQTPSLTIVYRYIDFSRIGLHI